MDAPEDQDVLLMRQLPTDAEAREMQVIELLAPVVARDTDSEHMLSVLAHAWQAVGMPLDRLIFHVARVNEWDEQEAWDAVEHAFYAYPKSKRRSDSRMLREMIRLLDEAGIITDIGLANARSLPALSDTPFTEPEIVEIYGEGYTTRA